ncbi:hypothetical protein [Bradyrhizobium sp. RDI18]|uniref:hypothetical protein n=1 Tax=Bradyrhizobium sp. RDI18 TaxID=3367400 RepID=UPI00371214B2
MRAALENIAVSAICGLRRRSDEFVNEYDVSQLDPLEVEIFEGRMMVTASRRAERVCANMPWRADRSDTST